MTQPGLYQKYIVTKADGTPLPENAAVFVLRPDKDPAARTALRAYAMVCHESNPELASDLRSWVAKLDEKESK